MQRNQNFCLLVSVQLVCGFLVLTVFFVFQRIDHIADCMAFGALLPCENCKNGQFVFKSGVGYQCKGNLTEWTQCLKIEKAPKRKSFKIPKSFIEDYPAL